MSRKSQERYRKAGLCIFCGKNPPKENRVACEKCSKRQCENTKKRRERLISNGICTGCGNTNLITRRHCLKCRDKHNATTRKRHKETKDIVFNYYGGYKCSCCGETEKDFLALDHINGSGGKHRKEIKRSAGQNTYLWIIYNNFPPLYRVLCCNCNWGCRLNNGICPHEIKKNVNLDGVL